MPDNKSPLITTIITAVILMLTGVVVSFSMLIVLNGYSESKGLTVFGIMILCQIAGGVSSVILARWTTIRLITKSNWKNMPAIVVSVVAGIVAGMTFNFISMVLALFVGELFS
jgi:hypothetical protein